MKRLLALLTVLVITLAAAGAGAASLLPPLKDVPMPSLGDILHRYPDSETVQPDGSTVQVWNDVKRDNYEAFSQYLVTAGAVLEDYSMTGGVLTATIGKDGKSFIFVYDMAKEAATVTYPKGTYDARTKEAAAQYDAAMRLIGSRDYEAAAEAFLLIPDHETYKDAANWLKRAKDEAEAAKQQEEQTVSFSASSLLPVLGAAEVPMISLGDSLHRYPDSETEQADGSSMQTWKNVKEADYQAFSQLLAAEGAALQDYSMAGGILTATIVKGDGILVFVYDTAKEVATVTYPKGSYDERSREAAEHYEAAKGYINQARYADAKDELEQIADHAVYKDAKMMMTNVNNQLSSASTRSSKAETFKQVGKYVTFGSYPQTAAGDDSTPIEWLVLEYDGVRKRALLISRYGLDVQPYNQDKKAVTWETSTLRAWLNETFFFKAFSRQERADILETKVKNDRKQGNWDTDGGNDTQDKVFLLSYQEAKKYFSLSRDLAVKPRIAPTAYAKKHGAFVSNVDKTEDNAPAAGWWLRSPGNAATNAMLSYTGGSLNYYDVNNTYTCVRPAIWVSVE